MAQTTDGTDALQKLAQENARLRGEVLATGIILAQLLQSAARKELNPHGFVTKIMQKAQEGVQGFHEGGELERQEIVKKSALETVQHYEEQIRSVLPI
jgi:hypothetical protein